MYQKVFGKIPAGDRLRRIAQSPNYRNGSFSNLSHTPVMAEDSSFWKTLRAYFNKPKNTRPSGPLPFVKTDLHSLPDKGVVLVWFGHSSYLLRINGFNILVDPVFSNHAAPFSFMVNAYPGADSYSVKDLPNIDLLLQTHDHYDHLDWTSVTAMLPNVKRIVTGLGTGSHFEYWGYEGGKITELDWWQSTTLSSDMELTATPARHFSGRGLSRGKTLWAAFVLQGPGFRAYLGGDSGYDAHFREVGAKYGPFDLAILECGQYNVHWPHIHMMPEETAQAAVDLKAELLLPVHWGKFTLSLHPWNEPIKRLLKKAAELQLKVSTPRIGEPLILGDVHPVSQWWEF